MPNDENISDEELEKLFRENDLKFAVEMYNAYRRENMWRYIVSVCRYFDDEDTHEVYQQSLLEFIKCVKKPDFDPRAPERLFKRFARFRAIDRARRKGGGRNLVITDLIDALAANLKDTKVGFEWELVLKEDWPKFRKALDDVIDELPEKQRIAALGMLEVYDEMVDQRWSAKPLAQWIRRVTGEDCTTSMAGDRWRAAKEKIEEKLSRAGFRKLFEEYL